ncbi:MAG: hypothetical protein ACLUKQ_09550, partial [Peptococcaceae bacterium]
MQEVEDAILQLRQEMEQADFVLVGAGAGLSAAAGISFADEQIFVQRYPYWAQRGLHSEYQMISFNQWTEAQQWAYMASHISRVRWEMPPLPLYRQLGAVLEGKDYYILT